MAVSISETWKPQVVSGSSQMCGDLLFTNVTSSWLECALLCLVQTSCFMFEFATLTKVCDVFMGAGLFNITRSVPRVVYKGNTNCERSGYTYINDGNLCINAVDGRFTWNDAKTKCETEQGRLLVLTTNARIRGARKYMRSINRPYIFAGLTDAVTEGQWKWIDGTKLKASLWPTRSFNNYDGNYPLEVRNADCAVFSYSSLYDVHCRGSYPIICERPQLV